MNNLTVHDLNAINELFYALVVFAFITAFLLYSVARSIAIRVIKRINYPHRIRTESGYLYRSQKGTYVSKERLNEIEFEIKLKHKQRYIRMHEYALKRLRSQ